MSQNSSLQIQHVVLRPGDSILISYALPDGLTPRISLSEPADVQAIRIWLPHTAFETTAFETTQDPADSPPTTHSPHIVALSAAFCQQHTGLVVHALTSNLSCFTQQHTKPAALIQGTYNTLFTARQLKDEFGAMYH
ncbi:hypothetical protein BT96DRAFT_997533 [Gymnopus androsaceus JB14]|uniref:Uncharacterized protein n=1 Tax=Gymnopus androsaceus JB14 TaxID=1447944 RepID=A0A6A4HBD2_9AGAR|nr:hypothetical protein BT96DRAFT_997533 [Gymnopus androsaceus JB14]